MKVNSLMELKFFFNLYNLKNGSLTQITEECGFKRETGKIYKLKDLLTDEGIIKEDGIVVENHRMTAKFKIDHKNLTRFLCDEFEEMLKGIKPVSEFANKALIEGYL